MLTPVQRRRAALGGALAALVVAVVVLVDGSPDRATSDEAVLLGDTSGEETAPEGPDPETRLRFADALEAAAAAGPRHDGRLEVAVMGEGWRGPIVLTSDHKRARRIRAWSVSKVFTTVALLDRMGWGDDPGVAPSAEVSEAIDRALVRSENCPQRRLTLELQRIAGGTPEDAREAIRDVLAVAGARRFSAAVQAQPPETLCSEYMAQARGVADPNATALLAGTSTWTVADAARFGAALGEGAYGDAVARRILKVMRRPKALSEEIQHIDFTAPLDWGFGAALAPRRVAYKAGWGGTQHGDFVAEQLAIWRTGDDSAVAVAVAFHPNEQPLRDDPGVTSAPQALAEAARAIASEVD